MNIITQGLSDLALAYYYHYAMARWDNSRLFCACRM